MLPEAALRLVREVSAASGDCLLVDGKRCRALLSDSTRLLDVCKGLRRGGFSRAIDFTAMHLAGVGAGQDPPLQDFAFFLQLRAPKFGHCALQLKWKWTLAHEAHPSLSLIWPACGLAEREMLEMLGIAFAGNTDLRPLLLDMRFQGFPLRSGFKTPPHADYAAAILQDRHEAGLIFGLRQAADSASGTGDVPPPTSELRPEGAGTHHEEGNRP